MARVTGSDVGVHSSGVVDLATDVVAEGAGGITAPENEFVAVKMTDLGRRIEAVVGKFPALGSGSEHAAIC